MNALLRAMAESKLGRPARGNDVLTRWNQRGSGSGGPFHWWVARLHVVTLAAEGRLTDAVRRSLELADAHAGEHFYVTTSLHDVVRFGRARVVRERLAAQAERAGATWWDEVCFEHAVAATSRSSGARRLLDVCERFEDGGRALDALEAARQAVAAADDIQAPTGSRVVGVAAAARLEELLETCGPVRTPMLVAVPRPLTEREHMVALLAASGRSNADIAERLGTSVRTVGNQLQSVYQKLGLHSREELRFLVE
jgi:DNA-binding CsgD family transcriptional regulator